jgi:putative transposase
MKFDPRIQHRRSLRLKDYDYATAGAYFVTICTQHRECLFGEIVAGVMRLNDAGNMIQDVLSQLSIKYASVEMDQFTVMPNHIHMIIFLNTNVGAGPCACPDNEGSNIRLIKGQPHRVAPTMSLPDVVHRFKSLTTLRYSYGVKQQGWPPFPGKVWQRNYYEHVIRNEYDLNEIREYILNNPLKWELDKENPGNIRMEHRRK